MQSGQEMSGGYFGMVPSRLKCSNENEKAENDKLFLPQGLGLSPMCQAQFTSTRAATKVLPRQLVRLRQQIANLQGGMFISLMLFGVVGILILAMHAHSSVAASMQGASKAMAALNKDFLGLVEKFYYLSGRYDIELTVGDAVMENSFLRPLGHLELDLPEAPTSKAPRPPPLAVDPYTRYGPKAEITHLFRTLEK
ncbi:hypothetical protein Ahy_B01g054368 [Arachis hypogaea]|uniref:Ribophorin II third domain-containing protein n=1 Tax=Arachis hypogaea TaxID=3818 RepID=A0A445ATT7_ARAHY|nr:hypothetical protein Ahy_B01g054368 [Arachis hypogaea]